MLLASSNMVSLEFSSWCMVLSSPLMSLLSKTSGGVCSCHLWAFPLACGMCIMEWNLVWSLFWVPCIALGVISVETDLKERKALSQPWMDPKAQPKSLGCCRLRCDGVNMEYRTRSGVGAGGGGITMSHGLSRNLHFESCPDVDVPTVPLTALELFRISHVSLELCWLGLCGSYRQITDVGSEGFPVPPARSQEHRSDNNPPSLTQFSAEAFLM